MFFSNSGAEAIECAIKLARRHARGRRDRGPAGRLPRPHLRRAVGHAPGGQAGAVRAAGAGLPAPCRATTRPRWPRRWATDTAAVLLEPIQGESGIHPIDLAVLEAARAACDEHGALLIFDEIQCGMGRTGRMWAWQGLELRPDVMTAAKGLGGGLPIGACVTSPSTPTPCIRATTGPRSPAGR
ncbi:MAG: aminotransferase class III-fold pyridoxal phosphate-dependent enzyme [Thermoleophilaceae bacterium]